MSPGDTLQIVGGFFEFAGLVAVMIGISETRRQFTDRPSLVKQVIGLLKRVIWPIVWLWNRLFRRGKVVSIEAAGSLHLAGKVSGRLTVTVDWDRLTDQEALDRLKQIADRHTEEIDRLAGEIEEERRERTERDRIEREERLADKEDLNAKIRLAAAGGLTIETLGATSLAIGIGLTIWGVWIG